MKPTTKPLRAVSAKGKVRAKPALLEDSERVKGHPNLAASRPIWTLPRTPEAYEQILDQFQHAFNRAPTGKELEYGFKALGILRPTGGTGAP